MYLYKYVMNYLILKDFALLVDVFKLKSLHSGVIYHCYNTRTAVQMHKMFNDNNIKLSSKRVGQYKNPIAPNTYDNIGVVVNTSCKGWSNIFDSISDAFKSPFTWLIMSENLEETIDALSRQKIEFDSDVNILSKLENVYILYELYHTGFNKNGQLIVTEFGQWNRSLYTEVKNRRDLKGLVLRNVVVIPKTRRGFNKTFVRYLEEKQPDLITADPMHMFKGHAALKYFQDMFNITYEFQRTNSWGYPSNGTFDGLVGSLQRMEADVGGSPLFIRGDRMDALDYVAETWLTKPNFIFRHPKHPSGYYAIYTRPFSARVWWCVITLMALSTVVLSALLNVKVIQVPGDDDVTISLVFLFVWCAICQQGMTIGRSSNSMKVVMFTTFLFALTLYQYYNATVVSTLLREPPKNIKTLSDLTDSHLKAGVEDILYGIDYFAHTTDPIARKIYLKKVVHSTPNNFYSPEQGMALVKKGGFAFHVDSAVAYRIVRRSFSEKELCELQEVSVFGSYLGLAVAKRSPYREIMAYGTRRLSESGIMSRLSRAWDERRPACVRTPDASLISVSLPEFSSALTALALGAAAALLLLAAELLTARIRRHVIPFTH